MNRDVSLRTFPVLYARDVEGVAAFQVRLASRTIFRMLGSVIREPADMPWGERGGFEGNIVSLAAQVGS
jgi:hypothetical protein